MRQYTKRKKITIKDVTPSATSVKVNYGSDEVGRAAERLRLMGWTKPSTAKAKGAVTYTVFEGDEPMTAKPRITRQSGDRNVEVVKRKKGERERRGQLFAHGKWVD